MKAVRYLIALFSLYATSAFCNNLYTHRFLMNFYSYSHSEPNYVYTFPILGIRYSVQNSDSLNFNTAINVGMKKKESFLYNYVDLGYSIEAQDNFYFLPFLRFENFDHYLKNENHKDVTAIRNRVLFGLGIQKVFGDLWRLSLNPQLFKDLGFSLFFHRDSNVFWGRTFHYSLGYKTVIAIEYFTSHMIDILVEGFYLETFQRSYKEYGGAVAITWEF